MRNEKVVMFDSAEAASFQTVSGWVDASGRFWGNDEDMARYCGSTHRHCKINPEHPIHATNGSCEVCRQERMDERFLKMEVRDWAEEPLVIYDTDTYFFDIDSLRDYLIDAEHEPEDARLCICEPNYPSEIDAADHLCDDLPEDGELQDDQLIAAFELLNEMIRKSGPLSWSQSSVAARLSAEFIAEIKAERAQPLKPA
ncbi:MULTISPECIES: hypothetical protein [unclassified Pseudomonas]|uniref:hypothetical protein n=1 Tax=unclassified Pseudomonas TaxID=196821 RepID=UPI000D3B7DF5|nr:MULTISPECIES: hypothetical protein [unclassified Pseudomonas]RAU43477.1 hypothetical protein DBP26_019975 [Pseudomonas sp. RIT 409]RAU49986.1 hypothetical protein DBY65_022810 [Pseudomonas sp. RIT 412]